MKKSVLKQRLRVPGSRCALGRWPLAGQGSQAANESLWEASRAGDTARITAALAQGADVNAKSRYDVTPLIFAAGNGRLDAVKLLLSRGADVNAQDTFYRARAADMAIANGYVEVAILLVQNGSDADGALAGGVQSNNEALIKAALAGKVTRQGLESAIGMAGAMKRESLVPLLKGALDKLPAVAAPPAYASVPTVLPKYVGTYRDAGSGLTMTVTLDNGTLVSQLPGQPTVRLVPSAENVFRIAEVNATLTFNERGGLVESVGLVQGPANLSVRAHHAGGRCRLPQRRRPRLQLHRLPAAASASSDWASQLARVSWRRCVGQWRRSARGHRMGRRKREEHQMEDANPGDRQLESGDLGRSCVRRDRDQQGRRQHVQDRLVR